MAFANRRGTSGKGQHNSNNFSHLGRLPMREATERRTRMTECEVSAWGWAKREKPTGCWDKRVSCHGMEEFDDRDIDTQCQEKLKDRAADEKCLLSLPNTGEQLWERQGWGQ